MVCPYCNRMLRKKVRWFPYGQRFCYGLAACPEHGLMRGKLRIKKAEYGGTYVVKTIKSATEEEADMIMTEFFSTEFEGGRHQKRIDKIPVK